MIIRPLTIMAPRPTPGPTPVVDEVTIGSLVWKAGYLNIDDGGTGIITDNRGVKYYTYDAANRVITANYSGYRLAVYSDLNSLYSTLSIIQSTYPDLFDTIYGGNDTYGLHWRPSCIYIDYDGGRTYRGYADSDVIHTSTLATSNSGPCYASSTTATAIYESRPATRSPYVYSMSNSRIGTIYSGITAVYFMAHVVKDAT